MRHALVLVGVVSLAVANGACSEQREAAVELRLEGSGGRSVTADEVPNARGDVKYSVVRKSKISDEARQLHEQGRAAGGAGDYAKALALFVKAHDAAPSWAYPIYDAAYTYELIDQPDKALANYNAVLELEPRGFFNTIAEADCLRREATHEWQSGVCKAHDMVEWLPASQQKQALEALVAKAPGLAAAWKDLAGHLDDSAARLQALERGLSQRPDAQTRGFLLINKGLTLDKLGKHDEARQVLGALSRETSLPVDVEQLAKVSLS